MSKPQLMLLATFCFFSIFIADILAAALWNAPFLSDVSAVLLLVLTSISFSVAIVSLERRDKANSLVEETSTPLE